MVMYRNGPYQVYTAKGGYIIHNTKKPFENGHTHIERYDTCMMLIKFLKKGIEPTCEHLKESYHRLIG